MEERPWDPRDRALIGTKTTGGVGGVGWTQPEDMPRVNTQQGIKEDEGKLDYELSWEFIEAMAKRMSLNKGKYPAYNWKKPIDVESLKQALMRHAIEVMKGNYTDDGGEFHHIVAIALNAMMLHYQMTQITK